MYSSDLSLTIAIFSLTYPRPAVALLELVLGHIREHLRTRHRLRQHVEAAVSKKTPHEQAHPAGGTAAKARLKRRAGADMTTKGVCPQTWLRENGKPVCIRICSFPLDAHTVAHASNCPSLLETHDIYTMVCSLAKVYKRARPALTRSPHLITRK